MKKAKDKGNTVGNFTDVGSRNEKGGEMCPSEVASMAQIDRGREKVLSEEKASTDR